jgi:D-alanyl-D-alanine carboxypeptidase (penicillin-binding protein 5/6)
MNLYIFLLILLFNFSKVLSLETAAKQAVLYDYETKSIIFEKNIDDLMSPSSMSKIMTIYYLFKKIKEGEITIDDEFEVSKKAWKKGGSKMFVEINSKVRVEDLIRGIIVQSGNDACIVVAEGISGSEAAFAEELNLLADEIGLKDSNFTNSTGWPDPEHLMTINDLLTLTIRTIEDFPDLYNYYAEKEFTYNDIKQLNRNPLLYKDIPADGLKTGHTSLGGYGLVATTKFNDRRLILVLNGLSSNSERSKESQRLMRIGFNMFKNVTLAEKEERITSIPVWSGKKKKIDVYANENISFTIQKRFEKNLNYKIRYQSPLIAPIKKNSVVAELLVKNNNEIIKVFKLYANESIKKINFFSKIILNLKFLLLGESIIEK